MVITGLRVADGLPLQLSHSTTTWRSSLPLRLGFDRYERKARITPALIVLLPLGAAAYAWLRGAAPSLSFFESLGISGTVSAAITLLLAQLARTIGKRKERSLWNSWGGRPTALLLRHR